MSTNKFKVGDKVRCVNREPNQYIQVGAVYTVKRTKGNYLVLQEIESPHGYVGSRFELVQEDAVLSPEEVFEHLRKGTKLEYRRDYRDSSGASCIGWRGCSNPQFANILNRKWRIKPEPEVIELNGKKYREIME